MILWFCQQGTHVPIIIAELPDATRVPRSTRRGCCKSFDVAEPDDESAPDSLGGELSGRDELPDAVLRDPKELGRLGRTNQVAVLGHVRSAR